jgi:hypothetical protein
VGLPPTFPATVSLPVYDMHITASAVVSLPTPCVNFRPPSELSAAAPFEVYDEVQGLIPPPVRPAACGTSTAVSLPATPATLFETPYFTIPARAGCRPSPPQAWALSTAFTLARADGGGAVLPLAVYEIARAMRTLPVFLLSNVQPTVTILPSPTLRYAVTILYPNGLLAVDRCGDIVDVPAPQMRLQATTVAADATAALTAGPGSAAYDALLAAANTYTASTNPVVSLTFTPVVTAPA